MLQNIPFVAVLSNIRRQTTWVEGVGGTNRCGGVVSEGHKIETFVDKIAWYDVLKPTD